MIKKLKQYSPRIYVGFCVCIMLIITGILLIVATVKNMSLEREMDRTQTALSWEIIENLAADKYNTEQWRRITAAYDNFDIVTTVNITFTEYTVNVYDGYPATWCIESGETAQIADMSFSWSHLKSCYQITTYHWYGPIPECTASDVAVPMRVRCA